ncbi:uncharacterized protein [Hoplias malabaricus]|uniref:uncharacterized protein isoform X1 n=1 Tax=Hoplias malabaricus TaxID=27720 RepID=UPI003461985A
MPSRNQLCPLCHNEYANLSQHLNRLHLVSNGNEKLLLLQLSSGRVKGKFSCLVPGCFKKDIVRLDKHKSHHGDLNDDESEKFTNLAKRRVIIDNLINLIKSGPTPPISVSTLSFIESSEGVDVSGAKTQQQQEEEAAGKLCVGSVDAPIPAEQSVGASTSHAPCEVQSVTESEKDKIIVELRQKIKSLQDQLEASRRELTYYRTLSSIQVTSKRQKFSKRDTFQEGEWPKYEHILQKYLQYQYGEGCEGKRLENGKMALTQIRRFLIFAGEG